MKTENSRTAVTDMLIELAGEDERIVLVCSDSKLVIKGQPFIDRFPDRYIDVGIAEQCAVGCAAGLASCGYIPFFVSYAGFITMRACEQVRTFAAYPKLNVKMIGANGGMLSGEREGVTHQFFEDIGILRTIPGVTVLVPSNAAQVKQAVAEAVRIKGPVYIRIGSGRDAVSPEYAQDYTPGKVQLIAESGNDVALFSCGFMLPWVMQAYDALCKEGIGVVVADVTTLKPIDIGGISSILSSCGAAVTIEDHNIIGGLGSAVSEVSTSYMPVPIERIGLQDLYPRSGTPEDLVHAYQMDSEHIISAVRKVLERKK